MYMLDLCVQSVNVLRVWGIHLLSCDCLFFFTMSSGQNRRWKKPEEPDWRTRENRGHTWFTNMKREKEKKNQGTWQGERNHRVGTKFCQRCYSTDHYTYECKNERVYQVRPSETQQVGFSFVFISSSLNIPNLSVLWLRNYLQMCWRSNKRKEMPW